MNNLGYLNDTKQNVLRIEKVIHNCLNIYLGKVLKLIFLFKWKKSLTVFDI